MHSEDITNIPTQRLATMGINILEQDDNKVKSCSEKGKVMEGEELLSQLTIHTVEETSAKTFMQKLASGEMINTYKCIFIKVLYHHCALEVSITL
jgi:ABC-type lipopolysaccharide export system ATPase subunit